MKKHFLLPATTVCRTCDGDCFVMHPTWKEYNAQMGVYAVPDFFLNKGYLPGEALPPARIACPTCKGLGEVANATPATPRTGIRHYLGRLLYKLLGGAPL